MKTIFKFLLPALLAISLLVSVGVVLADGPDAAAARSGVPDNTAPQADPLDITEGFDDITTLPGDGWFTQNNSSPVGTTGWFQGNATVFPAQAGPTTSYIGANFNNTTGANTISNWLLTPMVNLNDGDEVRFWTRSPTGSAFPDRLELRMSLNGSSTNVGTLATDVGDFTTLLLSVNPSLTAGGYPGVWTEFVAVISGVPTPTDGRIAFRYFVTNGGPSGSNSDYIGIDTFTFTDASLQVPDIDISVAPATQNVPFGGTATFTVTVENTGTVDLMNVAVSSVEVTDCNYSIGMLAAGATDVSVCVDNGVSATYTNTVVVTSTIATPTFGGGPTASAEGVVIVEPPTSVSLSSFGGDTLVVAPVLLLVGIVLAGIGAIVYRRRYVA